MLPDMEGRAPWFQARDCLSILNESTLSDDSVSPDRPSGLTGDLRVRETPCPIPVAAVSVREDIDFRADKNAG